MRLLLLVALAALCAPAQSQIRVSYDLGLGAIGDIIDNSAFMESGWTTGVHEAYSVSFPLSGLEEGLSARVAYITVTEEFDDPQSFAFPGVYLAYTTAETEPVGFALDGFIGYDLYNKEGNLLLTWVPTMGAGVGPYVQLGPLRAEAMLAGQFTSFLQGMAAYGRASVVVGF